MHFRSRNLDPAYNPSKMDDLNSYVRIDEHRVLRVGQRRVMLDSILASWEQGHSPETIRSEYPSLTLEEVYGAITWCLSHPREVAEYVQRQDAAWEQARARSEQGTDALRQRLRQGDGSAQRQVLP